MIKERVQKILAKAGIASRRKAEDLIRDGEVTINGKVAKLGDQAVMGQDAIKVQGKLLHHLESPVYLLFNKPKGVISMLSDPQGRPTLSDYLNKVHSRVFPVGRLDFNSEGLLILTNDGDFAEKLQKQDNVIRIYQVKVKGHPDETQLSRLKKGGRLRKKTVSPISVRIKQKLVQKSVLELAFQGAGALDIKHFLENKGFLTERMVRTSIGHLTLHELKPGEFRSLKASQINALLEQPELGTALLSRLTNPGKAKYN